MKPPAQTPSRMGSVLLGIARVARGRKDGLELFGATPQAVLGALTPLAAFLLVGGVAGLLGGSREAVEDVAVLTVLWLGPLVISFEIARRWDRANQWFRFATAFCWCQMALPVVLLLVMLLMAVLMAGGLDQNATSVVGLACLFCYGVWLNWFLARHALEITAVRAVLMVVAVNIATTGLILLPQLVTAQ